MADPTITVAALRLVLTGAAVRRMTHGRTAQLAAFTSAPAWRVDCGDRPAQRIAARAAAQVLDRVTVRPLQDGRLVRLFDRVQREHGPREVRAIWGAGVRELRAQAGGRSHG
jgi:hypothetical protein